MEEEIVGEGENNIGPSQNEGENKQKIEIEVTKKKLTARQIAYQKYVDDLMEAKPTNVEFDNDTNDEKHFNKIFAPVSPYTFSWNQARHLAAVTEYGKVVDSFDSTKAEIQAAAKKHLLIADLKQVGLDAATISAMGAGALALIFAGLVIASLASPAAAAGTAAMLLKPAFMTSLKIACQHAASIMLAHHAAIPVAVAGATALGFTAKTATNKHMFYHHKRVKEFQVEPKDSKGCFDFGNKYSAIDLK